MKERDTDKPHRNAEGLQTNGVPYHGPYVSLSLDEIKWLEMRLAGDRRPNAVAIREKCRTALASDPKLRKPHE